MQDYDKDAAIERLQARTNDLTDKLEAGMQELYDSVKYKDYLKAMSHFHNYSSRNIMLIHQQMPTATRIASYKLWEEKFDRHVKKGEKGLYIYAPIISKEPEAELVEKRDAETGAPLLDEEGRVIFEEMRALTQKIRFKLVPVFDVSQTYGEPLPLLAEDITGNVEHYSAFLDALNLITPLPIVFEPMDSTQDGYCRYGEKIGIRDNMSEAQTISAIIHEITHATLHDAQKTEDAANTKNKKLKEIEAESISYVICQHYGIETSPNSFGYLAQYGSRDMSELRASIDTIRKESNKLINAISDNFKNICNEYGIDITAKATDSAEKQEFSQCFTENNTTTPEQTNYPFEKTPLAPVLTEEPQTAKPNSNEYPLPLPCDSNQSNVTSSATKQAESQIVKSLPDPFVSIKDMNDYGYHAEDMLPLTLEKAESLFELNHTVYMLYPDNTEAMVYESDEIASFGDGGLFGITTADWERSPIYAELIAYEARSESANVSVSLNMKADMPAIYKHSSDYAMNNGEIQDFHASWKINMECGRAIDQAINESCYEQYRYDLKTAARKVIEEYGTERVAWVIAANINYQAKDGRLSDENKKWAKEYDTPSPDMHLTTHLAVLNGFADRLREAISEKPSLMKTLEANELKSKQQFAFLSEIFNEARNNKNREEL